jgi:hypothetical protein
LRVKKGRDTVKATPLVSCTPIGAPSRWRRPSDVDVGMSADREEMETQQTLGAATPARTLDGTSCRPRRCATSWAARWPTTACTTSTRRTGPRAARASTGGTGRRGASASATRMTAAAAPGPVGMEIGVGGWQRAARRQRALPHLRLPLEPRRPVRAAQLQHRRRVPGRPPRHDARRDAGLRGDAVAVGVVPSAHDFRGHACYALYFVAGGDAYRVGLDEYGE